MRKQNSLNGYKLVMSVDASNMSVYDLIRLGQTNPNYTILVNDNGHQLYNEHMVVVDFYQQDPEYSFITSGPGKL